MVVCQPIEGSKLKSPGITLGYVSWKEMGRRVTEHTVQKQMTGNEAAGLSGLNFPQYG